MSVSTGEPASEKIKRVNCRNCGYRVRVDTEICPHCHVDPRTRRPLPSNLLIAILLMLVLAFVCVLVSQFLVNPMTQFAALGLRPQPTTVIQVIYVVVTPSAATLTPTVAPTFTRPAPSPTAGDYSAPKLVAPANSAIFSGPDADISLEWSSVVASGLRENEWYLITISYTARSGAVTTQSGWSRETRWSVKKDWYGDASLAARTFSWNVQLMRVEGADPFTSPTRLPATPPSETRKFVWQ